MEKIKVLNFQPGPNGQGKEYIFKDVFGEEEGQKIDYNNYYTLSSKDFIKIILERHSQCLYLNKWETLSNQIFKNEITLEGYLLNYLVDIYQERKAENLSYYFFIPIELLINKFYTIITDVDAKKDIFYIFNFNQYINETSSTKVYATYVESDTEYRYGDFFIGFNEIIDYTAQIENEDVRKNYTFSYYEFNYKQDEVYKQIYKIRLIGPVGTCFLLNNEPYLIYISSLMHPEIEPHNYQEGIYELDTQGQILLESIIFPKDAIPEINGEIKNVSISLYYEDED